MSTSTYAVVIDKNGAVPYARAPLDSPTGSTGGIFLVGSTMMRLNQANSSRYGYLHQIDAVCMASGQSGGSFTLRSAYLGSAFVTEELQVPLSSMSPGSRLTWEFPYPLRSSTTNTSFAIEMSHAAMGTWFVRVNGFMSEY